MRSIPILLLALCLGACSGRRLVREVNPPSASTRPDTTSQYLKVHYRNGKVAILENWSVDNARRVVAGNGTLYDINRTTIRTGAETIALDSIALFETNVVRQPATIISMAVMTGVSLAFTIGCILNPKACFGSCPTFYAPDGKGMSLQGEGFSSSIAPALEATDIDHLYRARRGSESFSIMMTNEALETHVVGHVDLLAIARPERGGVLVTPDGAFVPVHDQRAPSMAQASEGDCLRAIMALDSLERTSLADSVDLAAREIIELEFDTIPPSGDLGLVLGFRESLMTTYLFYQGLAYMGREASTWLAAVERDPKGMKQRLQALDDVLGGIDVLVQDSAGGWTFAGRAGESGPIATNLQALPLPRVARDRPLRIRLRMAKGLWRINSVALASLGAPVEPLRLRPVEVRRKGEVDGEALGLLLDPGRSLVSMPGDTFHFRYTLPPDEGKEWDLFIESRGYYIEWMRDEWLAEQDPARGFLMFINPAGYLRAEAPGYKRAEPSMEENFWRSRYVHND